jgi:hypothetical protein
VDIRLADGPYAWPRTQAVHTGASGIAQMAITDLDDDGAGDLILGTFSDGTITIVRGEP